jgi:hypothetical protein
MKSRVLTKVEALSGGWAGSAYGGRGVIAVAAGPSASEFEATLHNKVQDYLAAHGKAWLKHTQTAGSSDTPICPQGAIKLPIDLWICKLTKDPCPIQAQVLLKDRVRFFEGCTAPEEKKRQIFETVASGEYSGFHHVPGRYLCVRCSDEKGNQTPFSYYYPWELSSLDDFTPFNYRRDMPEVFRKLIHAGISRSAVTNALCATHSLEITRLLYPEVAAKLRILEFEVRRPA